MYWFFKSQWDRHHSKNIRATDGMFVCGRDWPTNGPGKADGQSNFPSRRITIVSYWTNAHMSEDCVQLCRPNKNYSINHLVGVHDANCRPNRSQLTRSLFVLYKYGMSWIEHHLQLVLKMFTLLSLQTEIVTVKNIWLNKRNPYGN